MFKSPEQPYCRWCGKPIRKYTTHHYVNHPMGKHRDFDADLVSRESLQKRTNERIVSVKYHYENESYEDLNPGEIYDKRIVRRVSGRRTVYSYTTWDGESYVNEFFCNNDCEMALGRSAARAGWATNAWKKTRKTVAS